MSILPKSGGPISAGPAIIATSGRLTRGSQWKSASTFTLVLVWVFVIIALAWGIYESVRVLELLVNALNSN